MFVACIWFIISLAIFLCICVNILPVAVGFFWLIATAVITEIAKKFSETY